MNIGLAGKEDSPASYSGDEQVRGNGENARTPGLLPSGEKTRRQADAAERKKKKVIETLKHKG